MPGEYLLYSSIYDIHNDITIEKTFFMFLICWLDWYSLYTVTFYLPYEKLKILLMNA